MEAFLTDGAQLLEKAFWLQLLERAKLVDTSLSPTFKGQFVSSMEPVQGCFSSRLAYKEIPPTTFVPALFSKPYLPRDAWAGGNERRRFLWPRNRKALRICTESEYKNIYVLQTEEHVLNVKQTQNTQPRSKGQAAAEGRTGGELWVPGTWRVEAAGSSGSWMGNSYSYQCLPHKCLSFKELPLLEMLTLSKAKNLPRR